MKLLLDTHTFIWWDSAPDRLPSHVHELCKNRHHQVFLSVASLWEMQIKQQLGKLILGKTVDELILEYTTKDDVQILPILPSHVAVLSDLPAIHKDPFDRMLIAQAKANGLILLSADAICQQYPIDVQWL